MPYYDDRTRADRKTLGRKLIIHVAVAVVALLGGVAGGVEIADTFDTDCVEYDD